MTQKRLFILPEQLGKANNTLLYQFSSPKNHAFDIRPAFSPISPSFRAANSCLRTQAAGAGADFKRQIFLYFSLFFLDLHGRL